MKDIAKFLIYGGLFLIPFLVLSVQNEMFFPYITGKNFGFRMIVEVIFASWVILAFYDAAYRPKMSWIFGSFTALLGVMLVANSLGENPVASFWSNFERMEGYMALLHTWMYVVVAGSVLTTDKLWNRYLGVNVFVAGIVSFIAFAQVGGYVEHRYDGFRADATLGNATYMAVYMLFSAFVALFLAARTASRNMRVFLILLSLLFAFMIVQTATRGTTLGLIAGFLVATLYVGLFSVQLKKYAIGALIALLVAIGGFIALRDSTFVQSNPTLQRIASISLSEGNVRFKVWDMAIEGFKERPILGWGQSNFNYVFNAHYDPSIYFAEAWYDRVHNIFFDWLIAGGVLGFIAYFSIYFSALYYLFVRPLVKHEEKFTVVERGVLIGLLVGYLVHNFFVFDNIVSYIYYGTILALIHARIGTLVPAFANYKSDVRVTEQVVAPIVGVALIATLYFVNLSGIQAAGDIIDAFRAPTAQVSVEKFELALSRESFGTQEVREQMTRRVQEIAQGDGVTQEEKTAMLLRVEEELKKQVAENANDARAHVFIASFYRMSGNIDAALLSLERARELSPKKQQIIFEQGLASLQGSRYEDALKFFKEAYELDTTYAEARVYYAAAGIYAGRPEIADEVITDEYRELYETTDLVVQALYSTKSYDALYQVFESRIVRDPNNPQMRTSLAFILNEAGKKAEAIEVLKRASEEIPSFKEQAEEFMKQIASEALKTQQQ
jgi:O-antigen ligase/tetratricopeptide (TPR) repeat protein